MRVVVDTNVLINSIFQGHIPAREVMRLEHKGYINILVSRQIVDEWSDVIMAHALKAGWSITQIKKPMKELLRCVARCELINPTTKVSLSEDPDDNKFIECAIDGNADYIITEDRAHLHSIKDEIKNKNGQTIKVITAKNFYEGFMNASAKRIGFK